MAHVTHTGAARSLLVGSSAAGFSIRTGGGSYSVTTAPHPMLMLAFGDAVKVPFTFLRSPLPARARAASPAAQLPPDAVEESSERGERQLDSVSAAANDEPPEDGASAAAIDDDGAVAQSEDRQADNNPAAAGDQSPASDVPATADESAESAPAPEIDEAHSDSMVAAATDERLAESDVAPQTKNRSGSGTKSIELIIDSLTNHSLIEPIPVVIESLGDMVFTACVSNLNIQATGNSIGEALLILKEQIEATYDELTKRPPRDAEQKATLQMLQTYIAAKGKRWF